MPVNKTLLDVSEKNGNRFSNKWYKYDVKLSFNHEFRFKLLDTYGDGWKNCPDISIYYFNKSEENTFKSAFNAINNIDPYSIENIENKETIINNKKNWFVNELDKYTFITSDRKFAGIPWTDGSTSNKSLIYTSASYPSFLKPKFFIRMAVFMGNNIDNTSVQFKDTRTGEIPFTFSGYQNSSPTSQWNLWYSTLNWTEWSIELKSFNGKEWSGCSEYPFLILTEKEYQLIVDKIDKSDPNWFERNKDIIDIPPSRKYKQPFYNENSMILPDGSRSITYIYRPKIETFVNVPGTDNFEDYSKYIENSTRLFELYEISEMNEEFKSIKPSFPYSLIKFKGKNPYIDYKYDISMKNSCEFKGGITGKVSYLQLERPLEIFNHDKWTIECWVCPRTRLKQEGTSYENLKSFYYKLGTILGTIGSNKGYNYNFELKDDGKPTLYWNDYNGDYSYVQIFQGGTDIREQAEI